MIASPLPFSRRSFALVLLVAGAAIAVALVPAPRAAPARAQDAGTADLVVDFADGRVEVRRVALAGGETGLEVLERSGIGLTANGGMVCALGDVGCPASDCMCECPSGGADCRYWAYHHGSPDGTWVVADTGAGGYAVPAGAVEGWVWGGTRPPITATLAWRESRLAEASTEGGAETGASERASAGYVVFAAVIGVLLGVLLWSGLRRALGRRRAG